MATLFLAEFPPHCPPPRFPLSLVLQKRKAEEAPSATPPPAKQGKGGAEAVEAGDKDSKVGETPTTSRSGRVIKQKKFDDEEAPKVGKREDLY